MLTDHRTRPAAAGQRGSRPGARLRRTPTREQLLAAARRLIAAAPGAAFTIDELTAAARVAKGSFYNHFADGQAIADEVHRAVREREEAEISAVNADVASPVVRIARGMAVYAALAISSPEEAQLLTRSRIDGAFLQSAANAGLRRDLAAALGDGSLGVPSIEAAGLLVVGQTAVLMARLRGGTDAVAARTVAWQVIAVTLVGLGLDHGEAHLIGREAVDAIMPAPS